MYCYHNVYLPRSYQVAAYLLDHDRWARVPTSVLVRARHPAFCYNSTAGAGGGAGDSSSSSNSSGSGADAVAGLGAAAAAAGGGGIAAAAGPVAVGAGGGGAEAPGSPAGSLPMKLGSLQEFVVHGEGEGSGRGVGAGGKEGARDMELRLGRAGCQGCWQALTRGSAHAVSPTRTAVAPLVDRLLSALLPTPDRRLPTAAMYALSLRCAYAHSRPRYQHKRGWQCQADPARSLTPCPFVTAADCDTSEMGPGRFSVRDVHRIGILDVRLFNTDRHAGGCRWGGGAAWGRHRHLCGCQVAAQAAGSAAD